MLTAPNYCPLSARRDGVPPCRHDPALIAPSPGESSSHNSRDPLSQFQGCQSWEMKHPEPKHRSTVGVGVWSWHISRVWQTQFGSLLTFFIPFPLPASVSCTETHILVLAVHDLPAVLSKSQKKPGGPLLVEARGGGGGAQASNPSFVPFPAGANGCKAGRLEQPRSISGGSGAKKEHMVVVCSGDTSRKIALSREPDHLTAAGTFPDFLNPT